MVITSVMTAALAWIIDPAIKEIFLDKNSHMVLVLPLGVLAVIAVRAVAGFGQDSILNAIAERIVALAQRDMFASQIGLDIGAQNANHSGELISKFIYDTGLLRNALTRGVAGFGKELITLLALIGVMLYQDWELTVISVVLLPPVAWVTERLGKSLRKYSTRGMEETGVLSKSLSEALSGRRIIKAYNLEGHAAELANRRIAERLKYLLRAVRARAAAVPSTDLIGGIAAAFTVAFAGYQGLQGHLEINEFSSFIAAMLLAQQPVRTLSQLWTTSAEGLSAARRIFSVIDAKPAIADRPGAAPLVLTGGGGAIAFQDVSFAYAQAGDARAIDHVSLDIAAARRWRWWGLRRRQDHHLQPAAALLRSERRDHRHRRAGYRRRHAHLAARPHRAGDAGAIPVRRDHCREHRARPAPAPAARRSRWRRAPPRARFHRGDAAGL